MDNGKGGGMSKRITVKQLIAAGAKEDCKHLALFADEWPSGMSVTLDNCKRALDLGLDAEWVAVHLLSLTARKAYDDARTTAGKAYDDARATAGKSYNEATAPALKSYNEAIAPAGKSYNEARAPAWKAYEEAIAPAWKSYNEATDAAWKSYKEAIATAFCRAYNSDG